MKTNQILVRQLGQFEVHQRTKDGFFNATTLMNLWNRSVLQQKNINHFLENKNTKTFMVALEEDITENINADNQVVGKTELPNNQIVNKTRAKTTKQGDRIAGSVWMHPYLFIKFAMWLNPKFEVQVIKFVYDNLIRFRLEGGDSFKAMNIAFKEWMQRNYNKVPEQKDYIKLAMLIKTKVGVKDWNKASEAQNTRRKDIEQVYEFAFNNNLNKKETHRMINFQLTKKIN